MYDFDKAIQQGVSRHSVTYTRYADDLTFSAERTGYLTSVDKILRSTIANIHLPKLTIKDSKTVLATKKYKRQVTGLIITNDKRVSLGRERKRDSRAKLHHFGAGLLDIDEAVKLAGQMAFAWDVDREFYIRMKLKYGKELLQKLKYSVRGYRRPEFRD
jgi:RNA-directed DNA polymerase